MSRIFGPVRQIGHVVRDIDVAMTFWTGTLGIGPFFVLRELEFEDYRYRGRPERAPVCTLAFAQSGDFQIELIQQHNDAPSAYREFLSAGRSGVQHLSSWVSEKDEYDRLRHKAVEQGLNPVHEQCGGISRFCYFETGTPDSPLFEISEAMLPEIRMASEMIAAASHGWDGGDPVRSLA
jgi:hypothetical protein